MLSTLHLLPLIFRIFGKKSQFTALILMLSSHALNTATLKQIFFFPFPPAVTSPKLQKKQQQLQTPEQENKKQLLHQARSQLLGLPAHLSAELEQKGTLFKAIACRPIFTAVPFGSDFPAPAEW